VPRGGGSKEDGSGIFSISWEQFKLIEEAAQYEDVLFETEPGDGGPSHVWQRDHILVSGDVDEKTNKDLIGLEAELAPNPDGSKQETSPDRTKLLKLNNKAGRTTWGNILYLNGLDSLRGKVFANNLIYVAHGDGANFCPGDEPTPTRPFPEAIPYPPPSHGNAGHGVRIAVIDTGLAPGWQKDHPWLFDRRGRATATVFGEPERDPIGANGRIKPYVGHGTFIAGVIRCVAPGATVEVFNAMRWYGAVFEHELAQKIFAALDACPAPDIISLSAGCVPMHDHTTQKSAPPQAMVDVMNRLSSPGCRTLMVAAAGNDGKGPDDAWFYPAQFTEDTRFAESLVAVGALRQDREGRACFSNFGDWVTVYEDGEKLVNAFLEGTYEYHEPFEWTPPRCVYHAPALYEGCSCVTAPLKDTVAQFRGMATWSGTSFATPVVVGRIARHMNRKRKFAGKPRVAMKDLLRDLVDIKDAGEPVRLLPVFPKPASH
jgi:subtilisin family serine protease